MREYRIGIIGLGHVATYCHLPAYQSVEGIRVVAGAEMREDVLRKVSNEYGFKGYTDFEEMLRKEEVDIAVITTGPMFAPEVTKRVAEFGVNILVEKPMALTLNDAKAMVDKCRKEGVRLAYGETFRFMPAIRKAKEIIQQDVLGDLYLLAETVVGGLGPEGYRHYEIYPSGSPGTGHSGLMDHGIHLVDIFRWFTESEIDWVCGRGNRAGDPPHTEWCTMVFKNKAIGNLLFNEATFPATLPYEGTFGPSYGIKKMSVWNPFPQILQIHGTKGALRIFAYQNKLYLCKGEEDETMRRQYGQYRIEEIRIPAVFHPDHFGLQIQSYASCIAMDKEAEVTGIDGMKALQVILAAYESFENRQVVKLTPIP